MKWLNIVLHNTVHHIHFDAATVHVLVRSKNVIHESIALMEVMKTGNYVVEIVLKRQLPDR